MEILVSAIKKNIPQPLFRALQLPYHYTLALLGAVVFGFPSRKITVIAVTGTKGKSSVVELVSAILEEAGRKTALASTIHFKIADKLERNLHKMTMPGRFFLQRFLRRAVRAGCTHAVIEMTSEGARQFRHKFIALDALIFTNLAPEHIESHGSYENYIAAKVSLAKALEKSPVKNLPHLIPPFIKEVSDSERAEDLKIPPREDAGAPFTKGRISQKLLVVNGDDKETQKFLDAFSGKKVVYAKKDAIHPVVSADGVSFEWERSLKSDFHDDTHIESKLPGEFNLYNILAAASYAKAVGVPLEKIQAGIARVKSIRGRAERITLDNDDDNNNDKKLDFTVIVDYAHTPDSLEKLYQTYAGKYRICVLGNTGGGRDKWKRPVMAGIAEKYCDEIIFTNEDPYDENPEQIIREMAAGMGNNPPGQPPLVKGETTPTHQNVSPPLLRGIKQPTLIMDRREAIRAGLQKASKGDAVLITGKGTDPYIMGAHGTKQVWDDATVAKEELTKILTQQNP